MKTKTVYIVEYGRGGRQKCPSKPDLAHFISYLIGDRDTAVTIHVSKQKVLAKKPQRNDYKDAGDIYD